MSIVTENSEGVLKTGCRHVHAQAMVINREKEALAEEWHQLLCMLDPEHPEYVSTPIAPDIDAYTLAYAILLLKEGIFRQQNPNRTSWTGGCNCCDDWQSINVDLLDQLLGGALARMKQTGKLAPSSAPLNFYDMTTQEKIKLLQRIYGGKSPRKSPRPPSARSRLYDHLNVARSFEFDEVKPPPAPSPPKPRPKPKPQPSPPPPPPPQPEYSQASSGPPTPPRMESLQEDDYEDDFVQTEPARVTPTSDGITQTDISALQRADKDSQYNANDLPKVPPSPRRTGLEDLDPEQVAQYEEAVRRAMAGLQAAAEELRRKAAEQAAAAAAARAAAANGQGSAGADAEGADGASRGVPDAAELAERLKKFDDMRAALEAVQRRLQARLARSKIILPNDAAAAAGTAGGADCAAGGPGLHGADAAAGDEEGDGNSPRPLSDVVADVLAALAEAQKLWLGSDLASLQSGDAGDEVDPLEDSPLPSLTSMLAQIADAGQSLVNGCSGAAAALLGVPGSGSGAAAAAASGGLLQSVAGSATMLQRLMKTLTDMIRMAEKMLASQPGASAAAAKPGSAAALVREIAAVAAGVRDAAKADIGTVLGGLKELQEVMQLPDSPERDKAMRDILRRVFAALHHLTVELLNSTQRLIAALVAHGKPSALKAADALMDTGVLAGLAALTANLSELLDTLDALYGPLPSEEAVGQGAGAGEAENEAAAAAAAAAQEQGSGKEGEQGGSPAAAEGEGAAVAGDPEAEAAAAAEAAGAEQQQQQQQDYEGAGGAEAGAGSGEEGAGPKPAPEQEPDLQLHLVTLLPVLQGYLANLSMWMGTYLKALDSAWNVAREAALEEAAEAAHLPSWDELQAQLEAARQQYEAELAEIKAKLAALEAEKAALEKEKAELEKQKEELEARIVELEKQKAELAEKLAEVEKELEEARGGRSRAVDVPQISGGPTEEELEASRKRARELEEQLAAKLAEWEGKEGELKKRMRELEEQLAEAKRRPPAPPVVEKGCCGC